jgi:hypothetical protein
MQAVLPDSLERNTLSDLIIGETVYTVPWAMYAGQDGRLWLNGNYSIHHSSGGTAQMAVTKTKDGYTVDISQCKDERWGRGEGNYVGGSAPIPVSKLVGGQ